MTFTQIDGPFNRDAVRFDNGKVMTLQGLGAGITAWLAANNAKLKPVPAIHGSEESPGLVKCDLP
jgi:hypothetical protein